MATQSEAELRRQIEDLKVRNTTLELELKQAKNNAPEHLLGRLVHWAIESKERFSAAEATRGRDPKLPPIIAERQDARGRWGKGEVPSTLVVATFQIPGPQFEAVAVMLRQAMKRERVPGYLAALEDAAAEAELDRARARIAEAASARYRSILEKLSKLEMRGPTDGLGPLLGLIAQAKEALKTETYGAATLERIRDLQEIADAKIPDVAAKAMARIVAQDDEEGGGW